MGRRVRSSRLATRDLPLYGEYESILQQDLAASIDKRIKLVTVEQDPTRCTANTQAGLPIALHRQTHNVQRAALEKAIHGVDADAQIRGCCVSIEQSRSEGGGAGRERRTCRC